ncbi:single-stranded DNA-binding protein [Lysinibacillus antri]|uniref:Single-stranded DNA-binding protein n=1 Tax=Lysinibacillus antri TaxID=2498145 RepID=A0A432LCD3_9BACI|nr:single-stranded DNA-binding protein [Lysinibacillus antri]RUL53192.1 single-stranded DNA-binding protein [Lysinibacillus antri]
MNHVGLVGRITRDPVLKAISENRNQTNFVIAINRNFRNSQGIVDSDFVNCIAWGKLAERIVQYCGRGSLIGINGRLQSRSYTTKDNMKVFSTEVVCDDVRFYALKQPLDIASSQQVKTQTANNQEIDQHFVLPQVEEELPVPVP